jgi:hypothetical protein
VIRGMRGARHVLLALVLCLAGMAAAPASAQETPVVPGDTIPPDTLPAEMPQPGDTVPPGEGAAEPRAEVPDSVLEALRGLEGYDITTYAADSLRFVGPERIVRLYGPSQVVRGRDRLMAEDSIVYYDRHRMAVAYEATAEPEGQDPISGAVMFYELDRARATVLRGRTRIAEGGATWYVTGDVTAAEDRFFVQQSTYTSDEREEPQYHFQSDRVMVVRDRLLVGRPARLYFRNVPVAWLPFVVQDLERGRRSGLLTPRFGLTDIVRTSPGHRRSISNLGYYWAINDYMGAQAAMDWRSESYTSLTGALQYRWQRQFLEGNLSYRHSWPVEGASNMGLSTQTSWRPTERTRMSVRGSYASSSEYVRDVTTDPREQTQDLTSNLSLNHRFDWGTVDLGGSRRQSVATDRVDLTFPQLRISPNPITLFRAPSLAEARWYNNAQLTMSGSGSQVLRDLAPRVDGGFTREGQTQLDVRQGLSLGNLSLTSSAALNRQERTAFAIDTLEVTPPDLREPDERVDDGTLNASISYQQALIGSTNLTPNVSVQQQLRAAPETGGEFVQAAPRISFGSGLSTDLYGFFPGVGGFDAIRHRVSPRFRYSYSPAVEQTELQDSIFGVTGGRTANRVSLSLSQTFEARRRAPAEREDPPAEPEAEAPAEEMDPALDAPDPEDADAPAADAPAAGTARTPRQPETVTLLSVQTTPLEYDFARAAAGESGFTTRQLTNTVRSDYLRGLNMTIAHDLFDRSEVTDRHDMGRFSPRLSRVNTSFSFGRQSALVQRLYEILGLTDDDTMVEPTDRSVMPEPTAQAPGVDEGFGMDPAGGARGTPGMGATPGTPWNVSLRYSFVRREGLTGLAGADGSGQTVDGTLTFSPTSNWAVTWTTDYSITDARFGSHSLNVTRDLYRWQADFSFRRSPNGNTSFHASVRLIDLPDLRFDHREDNIGVDRRAGGPSPLN